MSKSPPPSPRMERLMSEWLKRYVFGPIGLTAWVDEDGRLK